MGKSSIDKSIQELRADDYNQKANRPGNEAFLLSKKKTMIEVFSLVLSASLYAGAFPPLNYSFLAWLAFVPLLLVIYNKSLLKSAVYSYVWGCVWGGIAFYWLREIEYPLPFAMAAFLALFPAIWAFPIPFFYKNLLTQTPMSSKKIRFFWIKEVFFLLTVSSWWCILEWIRSWMFSGLPWNFAAVSQWKNIPIIQIAEFTGVYGVSFLILYVNTALFLSMGILRKAISTGKQCRPVPFFSAVVLVLFSVLIGAKSLLSYSQNNNKNLRLKKISIAIIQANISQCRFPKPGMAEFALNEHIKLSQMAAVLKPDLIAWPETAVPVSYISGDNLGFLYRYKVGKLIAETKIPLIFGTLDYEMKSSDIGMDDDYDEFNSVYFLNNKAKIVDKYSKRHLVPFGEYTPLGEYYPEMKKKLGMGRDLTPGKKFTLFELKKDIVAGSLICYEDIFPEISREFVLRGANLLMVFSNDAWYPTSSEPEQHLANSIFRAVENRRVMVRVGNNSCSCLVLPNGKIADSVSVDENNGKILLKPEKASKAFARFDVSVLKTPPLTFYSRYGNVLIYLCFFIVSAALGVSLWNIRTQKEIIIQAFENE